MSQTWMRLDNAAKIFPAVRRRDWSNVFRLSATLTEPVDPQILQQAVEQAVEMVENGDNGIPVPDYVDENVSTKVVKIIQGYTGIVDRVVWRKY